MFQIRWTGSLKRTWFCLFLSVAWASSASAFAWVDALGRGESSNKFVRAWRKVPVEGAVCGDGAPYSVFVSDGDPRLIAFDLMGGGACWSAATCFALPDTWIHPIPAVLEQDGFVSPDIDRSPVANHTLVHFPYCTGDVHLGSHQARYAGGMRMHHVGRTNFELALAQISRVARVDLAHARQFVMMGYSAGALGALLHSLAVAPWVRNVPDKVLIADSPGLHFGQKFWDKFPDALLSDFSSAISTVGLKLQKGEGNVSSVIPRVCSELSDWKVGVLQGSRDLVMSRVFGAIDPLVHEQLLYGPEGVFEATSNPNDNCATWAPQTEVHTFLVTDQTAAIRTSDGVSAMDFVRSLVEGSRGAGSNHR